LPTTSGVLSNWQSAATPGLMCWQTPNRGADSYSRRFSCPISSHSSSSSSSFRSAWCTSMAVSS
jgi:hypothetical protein